MTVSKVTLGGDRTFPINAANNPNKPQLRTPTFPAFARNFRREFQHLVRSATAIKTPQMSGDLSFPVLRISSGSLPLFLLPSESLLGWAHKGARDTAIYKATASCDFTHVAISCASSTGKSKAGISKRDFEFKIPVVTTTHVNTTRNLSFLSVDI